MMKWYKENLNACMISMLVLGVFIGYYMPEMARHTSVIGKVFLNSLSLMIIPIVFFSLVSGVLNLKESANLASLGGKAFLYYMCTTALAVALGILLVNVVQPGNIVTPLTANDPANSAADVHSLGSVLFMLIPDNIIQAAANKNVLGVIFFAIFVGVALLATKSDNFAQIENFFSDVNAALLWMVDYVMLIAPFGIYALLADTVAAAVEKEIFQKVGIEVITYFLTVAPGLLLHGAITLSIILIVFRKSPFRFFKAMFPAVSTAFSTASSAATLPITIDALEERAKVSDKTAGFVAPLGATINMDGTAIYEAIAAIFIANMYGIDLSMGAQFVIFLTATFSAIGAAGVPGAGLIMMTMVLGSVGIPIEGITLIVGVDRFLDMLRTAVNVWGDSVGAYIIDSKEV